MDKVKTHLRIVAAFAIREVATRYGRSPGGYVWAFLEPIAIIGLMSQLMGIFGRSPPYGDSFTLFYATGFLAFAFYRGMEGYLTSAIRANKNLLMYPIVAPIDPVIGRFVLQAITSVIVAGIIIGAVVESLRFPIEVTWPPILEAISLAWIMAFGVAMLNMVLFAHFALYEKAYTIITRPMFMLSGVFYVPEGMPHPIKEVLLMNPVTHIVLLFREGFYRMAYNDGLDIDFLMVTAFVLFFVGLVAFSKWPIARLRD